MLEGIKCAACGAYFEPEEECNIRDIISCPECFNELMIISLDPPKVEVVGEKEDFPDDFEENIQ